jgi:hypothetical protein
VGGADDTTGTAERGGTGRARPSRLCHPPRGILREAFDSGTAQDLVKTIDPYEAAVDAFLREEHDGRYRITDADALTFTENLAGRSADIGDFCRQPLFRQLGHDLVAPTVWLYRDQVVYKKPGKPRTFPWHQDNGYVFVEPQAYITCWIALTPATPRNGAPRFTAGWHRLGTLRHWSGEHGRECLRENPAACPCEPLASGEMAVFSSLLPHCTGPNLTSSVRNAFIVQIAAAVAAARIDRDGVTHWEPQDDATTQFLLDVN